MTSAPASARQRARSNAPARGCSPSSFQPCTMTLAPARSWPWKSLDMRGKSRTFLMSALVTMVMSRPSAFTIGSLPTFDFFNCAWASSMVMGSCDLITLVTMMLEIFVSRSSVFSWSRELMKPASFDPSLPFSVMQTPLMPVRFLILSTSFRVWSGRKQIGSKMNPLTKRLARLTISTCESMLWLQWMKPMPPTSASPTASSDSVTLSTGLLASGKFNLIFLVSRPEVSMADMSKEMCPGIRMMSS
mmetsp:Transcript_65630/g.152488  ORF Transcript_65630/g.152488 Transcript_65630/m.152488 type:complete len:246 (-) Transcript_65630:138-875(-)